MSISDTVLFLLISLSLAFLNPSKADLISDICSKTAIDPKYCEQALRSDPRSRSADLPTLAKISIDLAQTNTKSAAALVKSLEQKATDPKMKERYKSCMENYSDTLSNLDDCVGYLNQKDYASLNVHASAAMDGPATCDDNFNDPPAEPDNLKEASKHIRGLAAAICAIASKLLGSI